MVTPYVYVYVYDTLWVLASASADASATKVAEGAVPRARGPSAPPEGVPLQTSRPVCNVALLLYTYAQQMATAGALTLDGLLPQDHGLAPLPALAGGGVGVPPHFESLVGYDGQRRYVSVHLRVDGRPIVGDGAAERVGRYGPFAAWANHPYVWPSITTDESKDDPEPRIVVDRLTRLAYAGGGDVTRAFLADASGEPDGGRRVSLRVPLAELEDDGRSLDPDPLGQARLEVAAGPRMAEWLGTRPLPCPSCDAPLLARNYVPGDSGRPRCPCCREEFYGPPLFARLTRLRALQL